MVTIFLLGYIQLSKAVLTHIYVICLLWPVINVFEWNAWMAGILLI